MSIWGTRLRRGRSYENGLGRRHRSTMRVHDSDIRFILVTVKKLVTCLMHGSLFGDYAERQHSSHSYQSGGTRRDVSHLSVPPSPRS